ncbi:hypothetical protein [Streptomyces rapamycinicus]|uniref:hypothetical protein n=1 Tax=Streptomyces rapamycinicus TaxID=1226757 RepID=UPI0035A39426
MISAKTLPALNAHEDRLRAYLAASPGVDMRAVASTLAMTRVDVRTPWGAAG